MSTFISKKAKALKLPIVDADRDETIDLTVQDIKKGIPMTHDRCAFARACNRVMAIEAVYFFKSTAWIQTSTHFLRYMLPVDVQAEITQYDAALTAGKNPTMRPGEYKILKPTKSRTAAAALARSKKRKGRHHPTGKGTKKGVVALNTRILELPSSIKTRDDLKKFLSALGKSISPAKKRGRGRPRKITVNVSTLAPVRKAARRPVKSATRKPTRKK